MSKDGRPTWVFGYGSLIWKQDFPYLGPAAPSAMAEQINRCRGPSGSNRDYVLHLAQALREMGVADDHVFEVESWIL